MPRLLYRVALVLVLGVATSGCFSNPHPSLDCFDTVSAAVSAPTMLMYEVSVGAPQRCLCWVDARACPDIDAGD